MTDYGVSAGPVQVHPETFAPMIPVTVWLNLEAVQDIRSAYALDIKTELAKAIGQEIVEFLEKRNG